LHQQPWLAVYQAKQHLLVIAREDDCAKLRERIGQHPLYHLGRMRTSIDQVAKEDK
jgi:hypothetical protein